MMCTPFNIDFKPYYYGPYSGGKVAHVLYHMNGNYIKGMGGMDCRPFDYIWLIDGAAQDSDTFIDGYKERNLREICNRTKKFLRGYYSNYSLELLASVDYLLQNNPSLQNWRNEERCHVVDILEQKMQEWSPRKERMFKRPLLTDAVNYLDDTVFLTDTHQA